ncbi:acetyltransferase (GNAT) family protein [Albidovulum inexpectatum]|uniref:Acetyltransferase (GNAT) family protein n=1 Tax=Albidovulum inexpectatum TaxID=196587 RepID=A0A2S5JEA7_9RHOB|nr:GNAT family N-acetyltransferase [Albidovulum inexpectatum]PPB79852.1 acetyltransferase (GNAT) family protein [Albidovulum inexpectatum]
MSVKVVPLAGAALEDALDDVARLRIAVFREWPYLYDGDLDYERRYLSAYRESANAIVVGAFDNGRLVGAATGTPMEDHVDEFSAAFQNTGLDLGEIFYCAESVLLPEYRGQGIGHAFFDAREAHARALGRRWSAFCRVVRPADHPLRPASYRPLDDFWRKRGYSPRPEIRTGYSWKDVGEHAETVKPMEFWLRAL